MSDTGSAAGSNSEPTLAWHRLDVADLAIGHVKTVIAAGRALAVTRTDDGYGVLDNRCPHHSGPLVMNNDELAKISREQVGELRPVWQTSLVNPDFAAYAELCGRAGFKIESGDRLDDVLAEALAVTGRPVMVEVTTSGQWV